MFLATLLMMEFKDSLAEEFLVPENKDPNPENTLKDFGTFGETFPISEKSLLAVIKAKLKALAASGQLEDHQKIMTQKAKDQLNRPTPVQGLTKTTTPRSFSYDPSITVPYDLKDAAGRVFHAKGTRVNPLDTHALSRPLLFVDGDDAYQVAWAIREHQVAKPLHKPKIILIQGAPLKLSKKLRLPIYFDQSGMLVKKLGITQIPAKVSQKDKILLIEEIKPITELDRSDSREPIGAPHITTPHQKTAAGQKGTGTENLVPGGPAHICPGRPT